MTDQIPAGLTRDEAQAVREWAERARDAEVQDETVVHAARVLLAVLPTPPTTAKENPELTDQTLDDQVRPIVAAMRAAMRRDDDTYRDAEFLGDMGGYIRALEALLPALPTLADMTPEERAACRWMQADVEGRSTRYVIVVPYDSEGDAALTSADGEIEWCSPDRVTPRPDLPRMEWPGDTPEAPTPAPALPDGWRLADHPKYGRVIVTTPTPGRDGRVYFVLPSADTLGYDWLWCGHDDLTYIDKEPDQ